jgi:flagellar protein FlaH|tara:strand:- start:11084 stop:11779 length:696 start_codon:yes stop_codon:yes gene_type:complete
LTSAEDGFQFGIIQDSLANSMGAAIPNRSIGIISGEIGSGKSLITQRLAFGFVQNGVKVAYVTTELTTRGWLEQVASIGYDMDKQIDDGNFLLISSFGVIAEETEENVDLSVLLNSSGLQDAEVIIIDRASQLINSGTNAQLLLSQLRKFNSLGRTVLLTVDQEEIDLKLLREIKNSAEVVLDLETATVGGDTVRTIAVTRFLRAAGPTQGRIGWKVMPQMGFIVDITAVS